jgi:hypothetical protein
MVRGVENVSDTDGAEVSREEAPQSEIPPEFGGEE